MRLFLPVIYQQTTESICRLQLELKRSSAHAARRSPTTVYLDITKGCIFLFTLYTYRKKEYQTDEIKSREIRYTIIHTVVVVHPGGAGEISAQNQTSSVSGSF